jgi:creatinine amidohydrolase
MEKIPADGPATPPPYDVYPTDTSWIPPSGVLSPAGASSAEIGRLLVEECTELVVRSLEAEFRASVARPARRAS